MGESTEAGDPEYRISSFSGGGSCVAVARLANGDYAIRHSRDHSRGVVFTASEFEAFVKGVKAREFDF